MFIDAILVARCTLPPLVAGAAHGSRNHSFFLGPLSYILAQDRPALGAVVVVARTTPASHDPGKENSILSVMGPWDSPSHKEGRAFWPFVLTSYLLDIQPLP